MLKNIRNFSKTITAKIFLFLIAIPFVFWGMGDVFTSGNTNSLAKINNDNISTQDFIDHINKLNINENLIKEKIDQNILEEILGRLISNRLIENEIKDVKLVITDKILVEKIKSNSNFIDDKSNFSRVKYEKFLITNNLTANEFEKNFRENEFQEELFNYLGGGVKSSDFLINNIYKEETKKIELNYINLENIYLKKNQFKTEDIQDFIEKNKDDLKRDFVDFSYSKVTPKNLTGIDEYNNDFFDKIDEIETNLLNQTNFDDIVKSYDFKSVTKTKFIPVSDKKSIESKIYNLRNNENVGLIEENDHFVIYKINKIISKVPTLTNVEFENEIRNLLYNKRKFEFNKKILRQINENKFFDSDFERIVSNKSEIKNILINSVNDTKKFSSNSLELIYSLPIKSFTLVADNEKNVYLIKIINQQISKISKDSELEKIYSYEANNQIKDKIFQSYDVYLNSKYDIKINQKTLERVKNYFR